MCLQLLSAFEFLTERRILLDLSLHDIAIINDKYKICNSNGWSRSSLSEQELLHHYYKTLARLIETIYLLRGNPGMEEHGMSIMLRVFVKTLNEGKLNPNTLRQHKFLADTSN
jgi:hypothetical protein